MSSDEENNYDEDQIINLISALQQKIKTNRTNTITSNVEQKQQKQIQLNEFSLQREQQQSKHSSVSENLSDFIVRTDKPNKEEQNKQQQYDQEYIKQKLDELCIQKEKDQEMLEQLNAGMMFIISQLPKPKQTNSIGVQTECIQQQSLTPNKKKTAQQTVQQMFQDGDRYALKEMKNLCLRR